MTDIIELLRASNARMGTRDPNDYSVTITVAEANQAADEIERLRDALQWYVDNDDTNEGANPLPKYDGQTWNEINAYWIDGLNRARAALALPHNPP